MPAEEGALLAELLHTAVEIDGVVGQFATSFARVAEHGADAAVDVDSRIPCRRTGGSREFVELLFARHQCEPELFEQPRTLMEGQGAQCGPADRPGVGDHARHIQTR